MSIPSSPLGDPSAVRMRLREAIDESPKRWRYALIAVGLIAAALWFFGQSRSEPIAVTELPRATASEPKASVKTDTTTKPPEEGVEGVVVQVVGAVVAQGVYEMSDGDRVNDAIAKAQGLTPDADVAKVNLAAKLVDGQQVFVPKVGEAAPAVVGSGSAPGSPSATPSVVNINSATVDELDSLPGIGPSLAAAIVSHREKNGPFKSVSGLNDVKGIGDSKFADLEDKVSV